MTRIVTDAEAARMRERRPVQELFPVRRTKQSRAASSSLVVDEDEWQALLDTREALLEGLGDLMTFIDHGDTPVEAKGQPLEEMLAAVRALLEQAKGPPGPAGP
jgi:hypothetical protein